MRAGLSTFVCTDSEVSAMVIGNNNRQEPQGRNPTPKDWELGTVSCIDFELKALSNVQLVCSQTHRTMLIVRVSCGQADMVVPMPVQFSVRRAGAELKCRTPRTATQMPSICRSLPSAMVRWVSRFKAPIAVHAHGRK